MNLHNLMLQLPNWLIFAFVVVNMLALGFELTFREIVTTLRYEDNVIFALPLAVA